MWPARGMRNGKFRTVDPAQRFGWERPMINVKYHPELMEQAVWLFVRQNVALENELHKDVDPIYEAPETEDRDDRFTRIFAGWFNRLRLDRFVDEALSHFPRIVELIREGVVRKAPRRKLEGAELFVREGSPAQAGMLVVQLCPESLVDGNLARDGVMRELQHVEDMLDPEFGYERSSVDGLPSHQQTTVERYRLLWDIRVERILTQQRLVLRRQETQLRGKFDRAFVSTANNLQREAFDHLWSQRVGSHTELLRWANDPRLLFRMGSDDAENPNALSDGDPCPVCSFPTFDWYAPSESNKDRVLALVRESVPDWKLSAGVCRQCAETLLSGVRAG